MTQEPDAATPLCPSAQPGMSGAVVFGVAAGTVEAPLIAYLSEPMPVTPEVLAMSGPSAPAEVFRFAAPCAGQGCRHFDGSSCGLARKIVRHVDPAVSGVPPFALRPSCRWWQQEGKSACLRCPEIVTIAHEPSVALRHAADPGTSAAS